MTIRFSYILAAGITASIAVWMASGTVVVGGQGQTEGSVPPPAERLKLAQSEKQSVRVKTLVAMPREATLEIRGRTEADTKVEVRSETTGRVEKRYVSEGQVVKPGDLLCLLDKGAREAKVLQANALLAQAELDFAAASSLKDKGFAADTRVAALKATRDAAKAQLHEAELELSRVEIRSPGHGMVESPMVEVGSILQTGQICATIIDHDPMLAIGQVAETSIMDVFLGQEAEVSLVTGQTVPGKVRYIAPSAQADTRTFRIEVEVANPDLTILDGITAVTSLKLPSEKAHFTTPGILTLDDKGNVGVRAVAADDSVVFHPVEVIGGDTEGVWLKGLPETVNVIVVGQDYVKEGQFVVPVSENGEARS
ncbi:efflux RND transporter periplasmic adaptor subunit [Rhodobacteraceae bacterium RKSG542]|uniref:efflux RND transporter periplasmic adaptor subunit n=1 Tax=Pseudovibrio flavus TaxID=2529854 RepID=UPI0012BB95EF|nr:efflux RND transporter periplasmic adaptor subunit [Pseudovibrio flavus]MTI16719.1 efflux RND transporter periplasmic adaptor subunit [Pseudovibrio flavus]